jgi:hypothetical protein
VAPKRAVFPVTSEAKGCISKVVCAVTCEVSWALKRAVFLTQGVSDRCRQNSSRSRLVSVAGDWEPVRQTPAAVTSLMNADDCWWSRLTAVLLS